MTYDRHMRLIDPMGNPPRQYRPHQPAGVKPRVMVSKVPGGWFLFTRNCELDDETPSYGVDSKGWAGYYFARSEATEGELLKRGQDAAGLIPSVE